MSKSKHVRGQIGRLISDANNLCHYCGNECVKSRSGNGSLHPRYPTKDHIFPKTMGGPNGLDNYVLACSECNNKRGSSLFFCKCERCVGVIWGFLNNPDTLGKAFDLIISANKVTISKSKSGSRRPWIIRAGGYSRGFATHVEAVAYLCDNNYSLVKG